MTRCSIARRTSDGSSGAAALEIIANPGVGCKVVEIVITLAAATASTYGLGRPAAVGITPTSPVTLLMESNGEAGAVRTKTAIAWGTGPTVPAQFFRRIGFPATIGSMITWTFTKGLLIPAGGSMVLWNLAANGVVDVSITVEE